jgi:hypothetical protein
VSGELLDDSMISSCAFSKIVAFGVFTIVFAIVNAAVQEPGDAAGSLSHSLTLAGARAGANGKVGTAGYSESR